MFDLASPDVPAAFSVPFSLMEHAFRSLSNTVKGMSQAELDYLGPAGNRNSTATLITHLTRADLEYLYRLQGIELPPELEAEFGPFATPEDTLPPVTGKSGPELLERYSKVIGMMRQYLQTQTDADATRAVHIPWWPQPATVRFVLSHVAGHSRFHQGQIARLREWYRMEHGAPD